MRSIGIAGTAKNSGKTTTMAAILASIAHREMKLALTSIGYDGERVDNITGLPKPRLHLAAGQLLVTGSRCLPVSSARVEVLERLPVVTPLGELVLAVVREDGNMVVAGPNKSSELHLVKDRLAGRQCDLFLVDGALNRIVPMAECDGLILATGAARHQEPERLARETKAMVDVCDLPALDGPGLDPPTVTVIDRQGSPVALPFASIMDEAALNEVTARLTGFSLVVVPGIVSLSLLERLLGSAAARPGLTLVFNNPLKLLVTGPPEQVYGCLQAAANAGVQVGVARRVPVLAVTVNPFFPRCRFEAAGYEPAYLDAGRLQKAVAAAVAVPVYNILVEGADGLVKTLGGGAST